jgi:hypothetical protein
MNMTAWTRLAATAGPGLTTVALQPFLIQRLTTEPKAALVWIPAFAGSDADPVGCAVDSKARGVRAFTSNASLSLGVTHLGASLHPLKVFDANETFHTTFGTAGFTR